MSSVYDLPKQCWKLKKIGLIMKLSYEAGRCVTDRQQTSIQNYRKTNNSYFYLTRAYK